MNTYALPDGTVVNLPEHCRAVAEVFQLKDGALAWAARVDSTIEDAARFAASLPAPRRPR